MLENFEIHSHMCHVFFFNFTVGVHTKYIFALKAVFSFKTSL